MIGSGNSLFDAEEQAQMERSKQKKEEHIWKCYVTVKVIVRCKEDDISEECQRQIAGNSYSIEDIDYDDEGAIEYEPEEREDNDE